MKGLSITIRLLVGRYHATPWDRHVNEGAVEWPPSPWRILRAFVAGAWRAWPAGPPEALTGAIDRLGKLLPEYVMPAATFAHTRHYMPVSEGSKQKTGLVFDAFAATSRGAEIVVCWHEVELDPDMRTALARAGEHVTHLGRAEIWAELEVLKDREVQRPNAWVASPSDEECDTATLLACEPSDSCWASLQVVTSDLHAKRWSRAPGTRWVTYALNLPEVRGRAVVFRGRSAAAMLFAVWSRVPVRVEDTVALAENVRRRAIQAVDDPRVHGHTDDGSPRGGHGHAYFIPYDEDGDLRIDHLLVYFPQEIPAEAAERLTAVLGRAIDLVPWKRTHDDEEPTTYTPPTRVIRLTHLESWTANELAQADERCRPAPLRISRVWESRTPFVLTRHPKRQRNGRPKLDGDGEWIDGPWDQVKRELCNRGTITEIERYEECNTAEIRKGGRQIAWETFRRKRRSSKGARVGSRGHGFRIVFEEPVVGPLALGYASHLGLGLFMPVGVEPSEESVSE